MTQARLFSPNQIGAGSFLGGPFAAVYFLWSNFTALGKPGAARATLLWGGLFTALTLAVLPFLPEKFPNMLIPLTYTVAARMVAEKNQLSKQAIAQSQEFDFQPIGTVVGLSIGSLVAMLVVIFVWFLVLDHYGAIRL